MKPQSRSLFLKPLPFFALGALVGGAQAATRTWDGGGTGGTNMETAANWSGDALPNGTNNDIAQWDGSVAGALSLTYTAATANGLGAGNGIFLNILGTQTDSLTITQASGATAIRLQNITIASGAGAFTFGNGDAQIDGVTLGSASVTAHTFTNNSLNTATFGTGVRFAFGGGNAKTVTFAGSGDWIFSGKFGNGGTGSVASVSKTGTGTLTINNNIQGTNTGGALVNPGNVFVNSGTIVVDSGGVVTTTAYSSVGQTGSNVGIMTLKGNGSFVSGGDFNIGDVGSSSGTLNIQDTASLSVGTGGGLFVGSANGSGSTASGVINQSAGTVTVNSTTDGRLVLGGRNSAAGTGGSGTYNLSGTGLLTNAGNAFIGGYGTGTVNQTGGTWNNVGWVSIARQTNSTGTYSISAGQINQTGGGMGIIVGELGAGTLTVSGSGAVATSATGVVRVGNNASSNGTVNLNGGTITTAKVDTAGGTSTFNFNGGTLKANAGSAIFLQGLTTANVRNGGALIDTNGNTITIAQLLLHSAIGGDAATDGGLTKSGAGSLTLGGANTYNGPTTVNNGTLVFAGSSTTGNISLADGSTLGGKVTNTGSSVVSNTNNPSLTFGTSAATNFAVDFNGLGNPTAPVFNLGTGAVTLNGTVSISLANTTALTTTPNNTTLSLVSFGSQGGAGSWNLTTTSAGHTTFALNPTASALYLDVTANPVTWTGAAGNGWNDDNLASPKNWTLPDTSETDFIAGDTVNFTNNASTFAVDITENIAPGSVNFTNTSNAYTIGSTGGFGITAGSVKVNGGGSVTVNNANTYAGGTTLNSGTLVLNNAGAIGVGALTVNGGTLDATAATTLTTNNAQSWNGDFAFGGSANLDMGTGAVTLGGTGDRTVTVAGTLTVGEIKSAAAQGLTKQGTGTLVVANDGSGAAASVVGGVLNVADGTLQINRASGATGDFTAAGIVGGGNITNGAATERWVFSNAASGNFDFSGTLSNGAAGALGFNKSGGSTQTLSGNTTYSGPTTVAGGTLVISGPGSRSGATNITGGTLSITGTNSAGGAVSVNGSAVNPAYLNLQNSDALGTSVVTSTNRNSGIQLQGGVTLPSTVSFVTSNDGLLGATVPYAIGNVSGDNTINGTISLTVGGGGTIIQSDSGSLTINGNISIASGQSSRGIILQGASTGANAFNGSLSNLSGTSVASITKNGTGTWALNGASTYTGATVVSAGTLLVNGSLGNTAVSVTGGALGGGGSISGPVAVSAGATLAPGNSPGTLTIGNTLTFADSSILAWDINALDQTAGAGINDLVTGVTDLTLDGVLNVTGTGDFTSVAPGTSWRLINYSGTLVDNTLDLGTMPTLANGLTWEISASTANQINLQVIPEASVSLLGLLGAAVALRRRR
ncbi:MAG: autotransporter-associated beta strand repeat-containing protein [Verrucomicrobia bacterium]|nr:autotransporter-associated beta strand repeat-containing protein [Verrucomicrobiota bacterium]